jgi:hypothetical protein
MSNILPPPSAKVMSAWQRKQAGQTLSRADENLINARFDAERQTVESKGTIQKSLFPDKKQPPTAQQQARGETQYAADYSKERAATMARNGIAPAAAVTAGGVAATGLNDGIKQMAAPQGVRKTKVTNAAIDDVKSADNMQGPHLGADGLPATWKMPAGDIGGRYGGQDIQKPLPGSKGVPDGYGVMQGADGTWRISGPGGMLTDEKGQRRSFATMDEVNAHFAGMGKTSDGDAKMREDEAEIQAMRNAADNAPTSAPPAAVAAAPAAQAAAVKMAQQPQAQDPMAPALSVKGAAQRLYSVGTPEEWAMSVPNILAAPGRALDAVGRYGSAAMQGVYDGNYAVPEKGLVQRAAEAIGEAIAPDPYAAPQGAGAQKPAWPASAAPIPPAVSPPPRDAAAAPPPSQPNPGDTAFGPNPVTNFVRRAFNAVASPELDPRAIGANPRVSGPAMAGPFAAQAPAAAAPSPAGQEVFGARPNPLLAAPQVGNQGVAPGAVGPSPSWGRQMQAPSTQYQKDAEQYNPLSARKRKVSVLPA